MLTQDYPLIMHDITKQEQICADFHPENHCLVKTSELEFNLKPKRNQAWSHHVNICVVFNKWTICTVGQTLNFLLQWSYIILLPWPVQKARKRKCDSRTEGAGCKHQAAEDISSSHHEEAEEEVGNWNFLRLLPQSTSRNVENQSAVIQEQ